MNCIRKRSLLCCVDESHVNSSLSLSLSLRLLVVDECDTVCYMKLVITVEDAWEVGVGWKCH